MKYIKYTHPSENKRAKFETLELSENDQILEISKCSKAFSIFQSINDMEDFVEETANEKIKRARFEARMANKEVDYFEGQKRATIEILNKWRKQND